MKIIQVLLVPVRAHNSTMVVGLNTGINPMRKRKPSIPVIAQVRLNSLGDSSVNKTEVEVMSVEAPARITFPVVPVVTSHINDNFLGQGSYKTVSGSDSMSKRKCCKLSCCYSCTLCNRAVTKERCKPLIVKRSNKVCERCSLCKSLSLCPHCRKCPQCCHKFTCWRPSAKVLAGLALPGFKSKGIVKTKGRVFPTLQSKATSVKVTSDNQWLF